MHVYSYLKFEVCWLFLKTQYLVRAGDDNRHKIITARRTLPSNSHAIFVICNIMIGVIKLCVA